LTPTRHLGLCVTAGLALTSCSSRVPREVLTLRAASLELRQRSSRVFDTADEPRVLSACAGLLQDLGFVIDNSEPELGLILASKDRTAREGGQVAGKVLYALLFRRDLPIDHHQKFRASIVTHPRGGGTVVRVTFQRIVWDDRGQISRMEALDNPRTFQDFFDKLARALFLEAHSI